MPRNAQGLYTLPAGNPVVPGTIIESVWANDTMSDLADAMTGSLPRDGSAPMTGPLTLSSNVPTNGRHAASKAFVESFLAFGSGMPIGAVIAYSGATVPPGYFECNGQAISRTTYSALFAAIGTTYGAGDSSTTFNVPDMRDEFIRGKSAARAVGNKQAAAFASHVHNLSDPGHTHSASQEAHDHVIGTGSHSHGVNDPSHRHDAVVGINVSGQGLAGGSGVLLETQTKLATTGISIQEYGNLGGGTDSQQPAVTVNSAATGLSIGVAGGDETRPQNIAQIYIIKAVDDAIGPTSLTSITTSDSDMISVDNTLPNAPELVIHSNVAFGTVKLDAGGQVPLGLLPSSVQQLLGYWDASTGQTPSQASPTTNFASGDTFIISVAGTLTVYDPATLLPSPTIVGVGNLLQYIENSITNPTGWYYVLGVSSIAASQVSLVPTGNISATDVQSAFAEVDGDLTSLSAGKVSKAGDTMIGPLVVSANASNSALRVTQTGGGNVAIFEDSANPDSTPTVIDASGNVIVGGQTSIAFGGAALTMQSQSVSVPNGLMMGRWGNTTNPPYLIFGKSRGVDQQTLGQVLNGDDIGALWFAVDNGINVSRRAAEIVTQVDGDPDVSNNVPGRIVFRTTPPGSATVTEKLRIDSAGLTAVTGTMSVTANTSTPALTITQTGNGNVATFADSANPDSTPIVINADGKLVVGHTVAIGSETFQQHGTSFGTSSEIKSQYSNDTGAPFLQFQKSRGTTIGSIVPPNSGDFLGTIQFQGNDGTAMRASSVIRSAADGSHAVGSTPGALVFLTTPVGATTATERLRINSAGVVSLTGNMKLPKVQIGVSATDAQNHFWDGSVANSLTLKRGTPEAPGANVITVVDGAANFAVTPFGTFTPTLVGLTTAGVGTYTTQVGDYRIVGKQVFFNIALSWNAHTGSGAMRIDGLPFANYNRAVVVTPFISGITMTAGNWVQAFVNASASTIGLRQVQQGGTSVDVPMDTSGTINVSGFYFLP